MVVALFLATELYPFIVALDDEVLLAMSADDTVRVGSGGGGGGGDGDGSGIGGGGDDTFQSGAGR